MWALAQAPGAADEQGGPDDQDGRDDRGEPDARDGRSWRGVLQFACFEIFVDERSVHAEFLREIRHRLLWPVVILRPNLAVRLP